MGYTKMYEKTDLSGDANEDLKLYLYPNTDDAESIIDNEIGPALEAFCEQIMPNIIFNYQIYKCNTRPLKPTDIDAEKMLNDHWGPSSWEDKEEVEGVHMLVYKGPCTCGYADAPNDEGAWANSQAAVQSYGGGSYAANAIGAAGIHEAMHPLINKTNSNVESMIKTTDSTYSHEHDLGVVYWEGAVSPIGLGYVNDDEGHVWHGNCSPDNTYNMSFTHDISWCSEDALCYTSRNTCQ